MTTGKMLIAAIGCLAALQVGCGAGDDDSSDCDAQTQPGADAGGNGDAAPAPDAGASPDAAGQSATGEPLFDQVASYETTIAASDDPATVYYPNPDDLAPGAYAFPIALLLQGADVERGYYAGFAQIVASYGFVVVVPDHETAGLMGSGLYAEPQETNDVLAHMTGEQAGSGPLAGVLDPSTLVLLGHSYGGVAGLYAIMDQCQYPFCTGSFSRPDALAAGAFYGTNMKPPIGSIPPVPNEGLPVALVQGSVDGKATPADGEATFDLIEDPPKLFVTLQGANHYGICDQDNPPGAQADPSAPTIDQNTAVETAARWSALFLRATVLGDSQAAQYISATGDPADANVDVTWQP